MKGPLLTAAFGAVSGAAVFLVSVAVLGPRGDGPLSVPPGTRFTISYPLRENELFIWDLPLPWNPATVDADIRIDSVEPVDARGVDVVGMVMSDSVLRGDGTCTSYGERPAPTFPPPDASTRSVPGTVLSVADKAFCLHRPSVLIGVRRIPNTVSGGIDALRIRYVYRGATYESTLPYSLEIRPPARD